MTEAGRSVVFISHKLAEVLAVADRITVMRRGKVTAAGIPAAGTTKADLASRMVGREVLERLERTPFQPGPVVLSVEGVYAEGDRGVPALKDATLEVRAGEIVGIAAVAGNGQTELAQVITGHARTPPRAASRSAASRSRTGRPDTPSATASPTSRRTGPASAARPNLSIVRQPDHEALQGAAGRARLVHGRLGASRTIADGPAGVVRDRVAVHRHAGTPPVRRQPPAPRSWRARSMPARR